MKQKHFFALLLAAIFYGCVGDGIDTIVLPLRDRGSTEGSVPSSVIPNSIRTGLESTMPIYSGPTPPDINGQYRADNLKLNSSSGGGEIGTLTDLYLDFSNGANGECTVSYRETKNGVQTGSDNVKGRVVGNGDNFTVYFTTSDGLSYVISGTKTGSGGISNLYYAVVNPNDKSCGCASYSTFKDGDGYTDSYVWIDNGSSSSSGSVVLSGCGEYVGGSCDIGETVVIGTQTWAAKNLNCDVTGSKCYGNDPANCGKYGRLYDWCTAMRVCPSGWHLPSDAEWQKLVDLAGGDDVAGRYLKATDGWNGGGNGEGAFGFSALPGGFGDSDVSFLNAGNYGYWWSASEYDADIAYFQSMYYNREFVYRGGYGKSSYLFSVRCIKDN